MNIPKNAIQQKYQHSIDTFRNSAMSQFGELISDIILFGSVARGEATEESDIDIAVIWKGKKVDGWQKMESIAFETLLDLGVYISIKVITPTEYSHLLEINNNFIKNINREGISIAS